MSLHADPLTTRAASHARGDQPTAAHDPRHRLHIRPMCPEDLAQVNSALNPNRSDDTHRLRLDMQDQDRVAYLVAWQGSAPIAHAMLIWGGPIGSPKQHLNLVCPYIEDLWVQDAHRRNGIGSALMRDLEARATARGHDSVGLSVGIDNLAGIRFYQSLGYRTVGIPLFELSGATQSQTGEISFWTETCQYMRRPLSDTAPPVAQSSLRADS